jgi:hypothetical protein
VLVTDLRANQAVGPSQNLVDKPDRIGPALAQVISVDADQDIILGQAWLAAANQLVTCGHVVDRFVRDCSGLFVYFPSSGKRYPVQGVILHPSFVRQPDGLVKFDAAVLTVALSPPDSLALPLPFTYEHTLRVNEPLWTIRYPVHLGQFSAAMQPLSQGGRFLGLLRKHDSFHLLHDVPLAPGDSGAPITDGRVVVAMHCGDTATIPGLNLPTTSIRLALWVDALRELGLTATRPVYLSPAARLTPIVVSFLLALVVGFSGFWLAHPPVPGKPALPLSSPGLVLNVSFTNPLDGYQKGETVGVTLQPNHDCYPFIFLRTQKDLVKLYPPPKVAYLKLRQDDLAHVDQFPLLNKNGILSSTDLEAADTDTDLYVLAVNTEDKQAVDWAQKLIDGHWIEPGLLVDHADQFIDKVKAFVQERRDSVVFRTFVVKGAGRHAK